jgi:hypothetical protein
MTRTLMQEYTKKLISYCSLYLLYTYMVKSASVYIASGEYYMCMVVIMMMVKRMSTIMSNAVY